MFTAPRPLIAPRKNGLSQIWDSQGMIRGIEVRYQPCIQGNTSRKNPISNAKTMKSRILNLAYHPPRYTAVGGAATRGSGFNDKRLPQPRFLPLRLETAPPAGDSRS